MWRSLGATITFLVILLAVSIYFSWKLGQTATRPVLKLAEAVEDYDDSKDLRQFNITGPREVEILTAVIKKYIEESKNHEQEMENTIAAQTESLRKSQQEIKTILDSFRKLSKHLRLDDVISVLIDTAKSVVYCNAAHVVLIQPESGSKMDATSENGASRLVVYPKSLSRSETVLISEEAVEKVLDKGDMEAVRNVQSSSYQGKIHLSIRNCAMFPLIASTGKRFGVLLLGMRGDAVIDERELSILRGAMEPIGMVLDNVSLYSQVEELATHDSMTGLLNHQNVREHLLDAIKIAKRQEQCVYIIMADIDKFKRLNDTYGHPNGDKVIKTFAKIISRSRRVGEYTGRLGGEEFIIVLGNATFEGARSAAERIMQDVRACEVAVNNTEKINFRVSMGIAGYPENGSSMDDLINKADSALYTAKAQGRDRFVVWDDSIGQRCEGRALQVNSA